MDAIMRVTDTVSRLPRGGYLVKTSAGSIQVGAPPETIKDTMSLPESVPQIFVLPARLFNPEKGISLSELEFPIYYNFFFKKRRTRIVATAAQAERLVRVLQEAVFGPEKLDIAQDLHHSTPDTLLPDIRRELDNYRTFDFKDLLSFVILEDGQCVIDNVEVRLDENGHFVFSENGAEIAVVPSLIEYRPRFDIGKRLSAPYKPPLFAVTCLGPSHGFDPTENTSGFIIWLNHRGIMVDPPVNSTEWLSDSNVNPKFIDSIILTHCHADHDAGTFQKIMEEGKVTIYTTKTVMDSFLRKYSALSDESIDYLQKLFDFQPVYLEKPFFIHGAEFRAYYTLHSIPAIGFKMTFQGQSFVYSSDHQGNPRIHEELHKQGVLSPERYRQLQSFPWDSKVIYHEAGIPPLHSPIAWLAMLPKSLQRRIYVYHIARKDFPSNTALNLCKFGMEHTVNLAVAPPRFEKTYEVLGIVKHLDFFHGFSIQKVQEFMLAIEQESFKKGAHIIRKGSRGEKFYIIYSGNVAIFVEGLEQKKIYGEFEYFGEVALMTEQPTTADVTAETDVIVYSMKKDSFLQFIAGTEFEETLKKLVKNRDQETWNILSTSGVFKRLTSYQKTWIESVLTRTSLTGKGVLVEEGEPFTNMYIIRDGEIEVSRHGKKVAVLARGDFIGELHDVDTNVASPYRFSYSRDVSLFALTRKDMLDFARQNPGLVMKFKLGYLLEGAYES